MDNETFTVKEPLAIQNTKVVAVGHEGGVVITHSMGHEYWKSNIDLDAKIVIELKPYQPVNKKTTENILATILISIYTIGCMAIGFGLSYYIHR